MSTTEPAPLSRHERRRRETRGRIISAAGELFGTQGVNATKIVAICELADVAQQTFFNHFAKKEDLLLEMVRLGQEFLTACLDDELAVPKSTTARLQSLFSRLFTVTIDVGPMHHELVSEMFRGAQSASGENTAHIRDAFVRLLRAGQAQGDVTRRHSALELTRVVGGALSALSSEWANEETFPIQRRARSLARVLGDLLAPKESEE
jgi:AcrR family transcriptional regulator